MQYDRERWLSHTPFLYRIQTVYNVIFFLKIQLFIKESIFTVEHAHMQYLVNKIYDQDKITFMSTIRGINVDSEFKKKFHYINLLSHV